MAAGRRPLPAYDRHMGFRLVSWSGEGAVMEVDVEVADRFANPTGVLHGGVLAGLADSAMGITVSGLIGPSQTCTNTDLAVRFLKAVKGPGVLQATARVVRQGRRVVVMECDVHEAGPSETRHLVARASSTFLMLEEPTDPTGPKRQP